MYECGSRGFALITTKTFDTAKLDQKITIKNQTIQRCTKTQKSNVSAATKSINAHGGPAGAQPPRALYIIETKRQRLQNL